MIGPTRNESNDSLAVEQLKEVQGMRGDLQQQQPAATEEPGEQAARTISKRLAIIDNNGTTNKSTTTMTAQQQQQQQQHQETTQQLKRRSRASGGSANNSIRAKRKATQQADSTNESADLERQPRQTSSVLATTTPAQQQLHQLHQQHQQQQQHQQASKTQQPNQPHQESGGTQMIVCAACSKPIRERYLLEALDKQWHEDCLKCACCDCRLGEVGSSLFTQADKILCRRDFLRIFGQSGCCAACKKSIPPYELVMRANENAYHMDCFACQQCQYRFCVGDRFHLTDAHRIVCTLCHSEQPASHQQLQQQQQAPERPVSSVDEAPASTAVT